MDNSRPQYKQPYGFVLSLWYRIMSPSSGKKKRQMDVSLRRLFDEGIPILSKANESMQSTPHTEDTGHEPAAVTEKEITLPEGPPFLSEMQVDRPSHILMDFEGLETFTYQNETKVQNLVISCLKDALRALDLHTTFGIESELSVFAYRPDIVVVSHGTMGFILVVEIKKPGIEVFESHDVGGQVYDYLVGCLLSGTRAPFAVLSSYDETCIAHLQDGGVSREILEKNAQNLGVEIEDRFIAMFECDGHEKAQPTSAESPETKSNKVFLGGNKSDFSTEIDEDGVESEDDTDNDPDFEREIVYTQTFGRKDAMKILLLAIRCALESVATSEPRHVPMHGANASGTCGMVNSTGLCWVNFPQTISFDYKTFPGAATETLYLWRDLGRGSKGRAFLACNSTGRACAVKFFLIDYDTFHRKEETGEDRARRRAAEMERKKAEAEKERDYWLQVYGDTFRNQVRVIQLNNLWCLMMPYFDQVLNDEREGCLDQIKVQLTFFKKRNLRYREEDLRWRHIGVRDGSVYIFDLGSLTPTTDEIDVDEQIRKLRPRSLISSQALDLETLSNK